MTYCLKYNPDKDIWLIIKDGATVRYEIFKWKAVLWMKRNA